MKTTITMVRHAQYDAGNVLAGRTGIRLSATGRLAAERLAEVLSRRKVMQIRSSPQLRAMQTAWPLSRLLGTPIAIAPEFDELDFGEWTGRSFDELDRRVDWRRWNSERANSRPPRGESIAELQARVLGGLFGIAGSGGHVAIFTHAEPIRAALLHFRRMAFGDFARIRVDTASLTTLEFDSNSAAVVAQNEQPDAAMVPT